MGALRRHLPNGWRAFADPKHASREQECVTRVTQRGCVMRSGICGRGERSRGESRDVGRRAKKRAASRRRFRRSMGARDRRDPKMWCTRKRVRHERGGESGGRGGAGCEGTLCGRGIEGIGRIERQAARRAPPLVMTNAALVVGTLVFPVHLGKGMVDDV